MNAPIPPVAELEARTIEGRVFIRVSDLTASLRARAEAFAAEGHDASSAIAAELHERANALDLAAIQHVTDTPGDSPAKPKPPDDLIPIELGDVSW